MNTLLKDVEDTFRRVSEWAKERKYTGHDPYDWGVSSVSKKLPYRINFIMSQINLYSPLNLRKVFKIKGGVSNKALALFSQAYVNHYAVRRDEDSRGEFEKLLKWLNDRKISREEGAGWSSYYFPFIRKGHTLLPNQVDIIATTEALKAYSMAYYLLGKDEYGEIAKDIANLTTSEFIGEYRGYKYIKYFPSENGKIVFNVSGLFLSSIHYYLKYVKEDSKLLGRGEGIVRLLLKFQRDEGYWPYSYYIQEDNFKIQTDYHQGFIIDGLVNFQEYIQDNRLRQETEKSINKAVRFYKNRQFSPEGFSYYRLPYKYPVDIHNQAQGIITFTNLYEKYGKKEYLDFAIRIYRWTKRNMWDEKAGYFYIHRWPFGVNKIPYMRWSQAWMMVALSSLLRSLEG